MKRVKRIFLLLLSIALVITSLGVVFVAKSSEVYADNELNINTLTTGDHIFYGKDDADGYMGSPYWRVLHVNKGAKKALVISEYLWIGDGDSAERALLFNQSSSDGNTWNGSAAQKWCQDFYTNVMRESSYVALTKNNDSQYSSYGECTLDDYVFFLSAEEAATYFEDDKARKAGFLNDYGEPAPSSSTVVFDGSYSYIGQLGRLGQWWLRSPYSALEYVSAAVDSDGSIVGADVWSGIYARPAFYLDLSTDISAFKNSDGAWVIQTNDDLDWEFDNGELLIRGDGAMPRFERGNAPWKDYYDQIKTIRVDSGITKIYKDSFYGCSALEEIYLPKSLKYISSWCIERDNADQIDGYFEGSAEQWTDLTSYGNNADDPLMLVKMHFLTHSGCNLLSIDNTEYWGYRGRTQKLKFYGGVYNDENTLTELTIPWDFNSFANDAHEPDGSLALASLILSADVYRWDLVDSNLRALGFSDIASGNNCHLDVGDESHLGYTALDRVGYAIASTVKTIDGMKTNVIVIVCRGSSGYFGLEKEWSEDWKSNVLSGANGFALAAADVKAGLRSYINDHNIDTSKPTKILITGHSRGAAVANILGAYIPSDIANSNNVFVYTFACPNTTTAENRSDYTNINNIVLDGDKVPGLPHMVAFNGNCKYGNTMKLETLNQYDVTQERVFQSITGGVSLGVIDNPDLATVNDYKARIAGYNIQHHAPALYMAGMYSSICIADWNGRELYESMSDFRYEGDFIYKIKCISVKCPVDVMIYDEKGELLGTIIDNKASEDLLENGLYADIRGDQKYIYTGLDSNLKIKLIGTDKGQMEYAVEELGLYSGNEIATKKYRNVELEDGKIMESVIAGDYDIGATNLLVLDKDDNIIAEVQENGIENDAFDSICEHEWEEEYTIDEPATCTKAGSKSIHCARCGDTKDAVVIPATGNHSYGAWTITKRATELAAGKKSHKCSVCGRTVVKAIARLAPTLKAVKIAKPKAGKKSAVIKWKKISKKNLKKTKKVQIQVSTKRNFSSIVKSTTASAKKSSKKITGLKKGKKYYVRVRALTGNHCSKWSSVKTFKVK